MSEFGIVGDEFGTDLPQTEVKEQDLQAERRAAKFSKTREYKALKEHLQQRIDFYQKVLPDGRALTAVDLHERSQQWLVANAIIGELKAIIDAYDQAAERIKEVSHAAE